MGDGGGAGGVEGVEVSSPAFRYRCEKHNTNYVRYPCAGNMDRVAAIKEKFGDKYESHLGPLYHCKSCRGNDLIELDSPPEPKVAAHKNIHQETSPPTLPQKSPAESSGDPTDELRDIYDAIEEYQSRGEPATRMVLHNLLGIKAYKIDLHIKTLRNRGKIEIVPKSFPNAFVIKGTSNVKPSPHLSEKRQAMIQDATISSSKGADGDDKVVCSTPSCDKVLQSDIQKPKDDEIVLLKDIQTSGMLPETAPEKDEKEDTEGIAICPRPDCEAPGSPVKIDKLGRSMGMCAACVAARGRRGGFGMIQSRKLMSSVEATLDQPKYAELKKWLEDQGEENERTVM